MNLKESGMPDGLAEEQKQEPHWEESVAPFDEFKPREAAGFAAEYTSSFIERLRPRFREA